MLDYLEILNALIRQIDGKLLAIQDGKLRDDDIELLIDYGLQGARVVTLYQRTMPFCLALIELSAQMSITYSDLRLEQALIRRASHLRGLRHSNNNPVAIFGASFNPTTLGHADFIHRLLHQHPEDFATVCLIPSRQSPLKSKADYASVADRLHILELVLHTEMSPAERARLRIETLEVVRDAPSWMVMTVCALILMHQAEETYTLACGYDHILAMQDWYQWQAFAGLCTLSFYPRAGIALANDVHINACIALCKAGIKSKILFADESEQKAFFTAWKQHMVNDSLAQNLELIYDPAAQIRSSSATEIRAFYQHPNLQQSRPPEITPEAHRYIVTHGCYSTDPNQFC